MAGEGTELIMLGNLRMCQEVFAFWEIEVRRIDTWELVFRKENYFFGCYFKSSCQFIELKRMETGKDIIEK